MSLKKLLSLVCLLIAVLGIYALEFSPGQLIIKTREPVAIKNGKTGLNALDRYLGNMGASAIKPMRGMPSNRYFMVSISGNPDWDKIKAGQLKFEGVEYIQPNYLNRMLIEPNDPLYPQQMHAMCSIPQAWNLSTGSSQVVVGVVDSGILRDHPDLAANVWYNDNEIPDNGIDDDNNGYVDDYSGWDFCDAPELVDEALGDYLDPDNDVTDENFHGTHVAGIIGAVGNNATGVSGVCWNVKIMAIRAGFRTVGGQGYLQDDDAAAALIYGADMGCRVINMSWGDPNYSPIIADACEYAASRGVILVASAGNDPIPVLSYPARLSEVISVGAVNKTRTIAGFSSYGVDLDLVAPGEGVLSTYKLDEGEMYFEQNGTSMSSPYVVGGIALLLSIMPELSPGEVRSRLLTSCDDLGDLGVDIKYGHGLLNVRHLLENTNPPAISITNPSELSGISSPFEITGSIVGSDFFRYSVMRSGKTSPSALDWRNVANDQTQPLYYYQQVEDGVIAPFNIPDALAEGKYLIRIQYEDKLGKKFNLYRSVIYDHSLPYIRENTLTGFKRYDAQNLRYYASAMFNESVRSYLRISASDGSTHYSYAVTLDSLQVWALPPSIPPGNIGIEVFANNTAGLSMQSSLIPNFMNIQYIAIPSYGWEKTEIGTARVPLAKNYDFDGNGMPEYAAMELPTSGYGRVRIYEPTPAGHIVKHDMNDNYQLLGLGNTNAAGVELLTHKADRAYLRETVGTDLYPSTIVWADTSVSGGTIAVFNTNGIPGVLTIKNLPAENVIQAYTRNANGSMGARNTLHNPTATNLRNSFVPTIIVDNLDGDNIPDILAADTDGDLLIYEIINQNVEQLRWTKRMPVANTYQLACGDFDGNGRKDFMAGGYFTDVLNPDMNFWYFEAFTSNSDNHYSSMGSIMFNTVQVQNSIAAEDIDNDGSSELIMALSPNLYTVKFQNGQFVPTFFAQSYRTYQLHSWRDANNSVNFMTNYRVSADSLVAVQWSPDEPFTGPPTPVLQTINPLNESSVRLSWLRDSAQAYRVYRKNPDQTVQMIAEVDATSYTDTGLNSGQTYAYALSALNYAYNPEESIPTLWRELTPNPRPDVLSIRMVNDRELRVVFNQQMANDIINPGYFFVNRGIGNPSSVNTILDHHGVLLRFTQSFSSALSPYTLNLRNVYGSTGVIPVSDFYTFDYVVDTVPPELTATVILPDQKSVRLMFSEDLLPETVADLENYLLTCPQNDTDNRIESVSFNEAQDSQSVTITLKSKLRYSNGAYYIRISRLQDLAGNLISPQYNLARFLLTDIKDLSKLKVYPNPAKPESGNWLTFINFPAGKQGRLAIYDAAGSLVYKTSIGPFDPVSNNITWRWNMINQKGLKVSSGIYYYVVDMGKDTARGKIAIIK